MRVTAKLVTMGLLAMGAGIDGARPRNDDSNAVVTMPYEKSKKLVNFLPDPAATTGDGGCRSGEQCKWAVMQYSSTCRYLVRSNKKHTIAHTRRLVYSVCCCCRTDRRLTAFRVRRSAGAAFEQW